MSYTLEKLIRELRLQLGWEIKNGGPMYNHVREFSKLYSKDQREVLEVYISFAQAGIIFGYNRTLRSQLSHFLLYIIQVITVNERRKK